MWWSSLYILTRSLNGKGVIDSLGKRVITMEHDKIVRDDPEGRYVL